MSARTVLKGAVQRSLRPVRRVPTGVGVALTFDDGPDPRTTTAVLRVLAEHGAQATFFLVGERAARHPAVVRGMAEAGHAVGSHSFSHPVPWQCTTRELVADYRAGHRAVEAALGRPTRLFRPPHGHLGPSSAAALHLLRLRPVLWSCDPEDWRAGVDAERIRARLADVCEGEVVLLHDALVPRGEADGLPAPSDQARTHTLGSLPGVLRDLEQRGLPAVIVPCGGRR